MASSEGRCYLLELPPELRVLNYEYTISDLSKRVTKTKGSQRTRLAARRLIRDCKNLLKQSAILHTSRHIMLEGLPTYLEALQVKVRLLKATLDDDLYDMFRPTKSSVSLGLRLYPFEDIGNARKMHKMVELLEHRYEGWNDIEARANQMAGKHS